MSDKYKILSKDYIEHVAFLYWLIINDLKKTFQDILNMVSQV
jgi:hypothetical protein